MKEINQFEGFYSFLSNDYPRAIEIDGIYYYSVTNAFWSHFIQTEEEKILISSMSPKDCREYSKRIVLPDNWNLERVSVMEKLLDIKFGPDTGLLRLLLDTQDSPLRYFNQEDDTFWGINVFTGEGKNVLGGILMNIRERYRVKESD